MITRFFKESGVEYHTYLPPEEKNLNIIIRGIYGIPPVEVKENLKFQGFHPIECHSLKTKGGPSKLMKVLLSKEETEISNVK